ncbi:MAG TPA: hypothetical protein VE035_14250, partial [Puia sp.]|nr:hypothetical protein [Puia sp.]
MKRMLFLLAILWNFSSVYAQWSLTGNSATTPPTNFIGTTDGKKLIFKVNNLQSGLLDYDVTLANTAFGHQALLSNTGSSNTAFGYFTLTSNTTAVLNDAFGFRSMYSNTTGNANSAFGSYSLSSNTTGQNNISLGSASLSSNTTGSYNTG